MESKLKFFQNRTIFLTLDASGRASADINIPFTVNKVIFRSLAYDDQQVAPVQKYCVLNSDLIQWNSIGICYRDDTYSSSAAQANEYHFQTPTKISGRYSFQTVDLGNTPCAGCNGDKIVVIAEFIRGETSGLD